MQFLGKLKSDISVTFGRGVMIQLSYDDQMYHMVSYDAQYYLCDGMTSLYGDVFIIIYCTLSFKRSEFFTISSALIFISVHLELYYVQAYSYDVA